MNGLWIGLCADDTLKNTVLKNGGRFLSAYVSQTNIFNGLTENGLSLDSINTNQLSAYPKYKKLKIPAYQWECSGTKHQSVGYWNIKYLNRISCKNALVRAAKQWAKENRAQKDPLIFVYQMHTPFLAAAAAVKQIIPGARIILIVPDLPQYMDLHMSRIKQYLKQLDWKQIQKLMPYVDKYILYSKHMASFLKLRDDQWTVMEGSVSPADCTEPYQGEHQKAIMYSGICDLRYGIPLLLDAFSKVEDPDCELWITGIGNAVGLIQERAETDPRIHYYGYLPSRQDLIRKQQQAMAMINMRMPNEEASAYCFPSKLFEYMLSGNPVLSFRIPGIPDEYFEHLIAMEHVTAESVAESIRTILQMDPAEREQIGVSGREFIVQHKNYKEQTKKMISFCLR